MSGAYSVRLEARAVIGLLFRRASPMKKLFLASLLLTATAAIAADQQSAKLNGWISDSMCGQKHAGKANVACVKKCVEGGSKAVFVDDQKKQVWAIDNPDAIMNHLGHHVAVTATKDDSSKSIHINEVKMLADQGSTGGI